MLKAFIFHTVKIALVLPGLIGILYGLMQAGNASGFDKSYPATHQSLVDFVNLLLVICVEHWLGWLILSALLGAVWTLYAGGPIANSKQKFDEERKRRLPRRSDDDDD